MPLRVRNVVIDCKDPKGLAEFWAAVLETYQMQGSGDDWAAIIDRERRDPRIYFQKVPEPKAVKNRVHLDFNVDDVQVEAARIESLGGKVYMRVEEGDDLLIVMTDPEGNEFCLQADPEPWYD
jgi:predicted enzyme related to lactoylglutathione lyase